MPDTIQLIPLKDLLKYWGMVVFPARYGGGFYAIHCEDRYSTHVQEGLTSGWYDEVKYLEDLVALDIWPGAYGETPEVAIGDLHAKMSIIEQDQSIKNVDYNYFLCLSLRVLRANMDLPKVDKTVDSGTVVAQMIEAMEKFDATTDLTNYTKC